MNWHPVPSIVGRIAVLLTIIFAGSGQAQQVDTTRADSIRRVLRAKADSVEKARADSLRRFQLAAVVVTATRLSTIDERVPAQVEALDLSDIPGPVGAPDALLRMPGVTSFNDQGTPFQPEIQIRGFTVSGIVGTPQGISVFLNGVRVNEADAQEVNFDLLPMAAVDNATLVRGANVLFGRNSLGGTLLLQTRRGTERPFAEVEWGGGSFGRQMLTLSAGGKVGRVDGFVAATGLNEVGWRQATAARTRNVFTTLGYQWGPTHNNGDLALDVLYGKDRIEEAGSLPESWVGPYPRLNYTGGDFFGPEAYQVALRGNQPVGGGLFRGTLFLRRNEFEQFNGNVPPPNTDGFTTNASKGGVAEWTRAILVGVPVGFTAGVDYQRDSVRVEFNNVGGRGPDSTTTIADVSPQENMAFYTQAVVSASTRMDVTVGLRFDHIRIPYRDRLNSANDSVNTYNRVSPEIGVVYRFTPVMKGYVAYKHGFRAPSPLELACASPEAPCSLGAALGADPHLEPVVTQNYEVGFDVETPSHAAIDINAFFTEVANDIHFASPSLTQVYFINVPRTRRVGVEVAGALPIGTGGRVFGSFSHIAATFQSTVQIATADTAPAPAEPGDRFANAPLNTWRVGLGMKHHRGSIFFDGEFDVRGYSSQYLRGDESNRRAPLPGYNVASLRGQMTFSQFRVAFEIENLFNRTYTAFGIEAATGLFPPGSHIALDDDNAPFENFLTPGLPRRFVVTVSARL